MQDELNPANAPADGLKVGSETPTEPTPSIEDALKAAEQAAAEHHDAWLRARAETENLRRRAQGDIDNARKFAIENFATELLAVKDSLEAALASDVPTIEVMKDGVELTLKQLNAVFGKFNLVDVAPLGEKFDPHRHQAIGMLDSEQPANTVVSVLQKGYVLNDRTIRPALVMVAKGKD